MQGNSHVGNIGNNRLDSVPRALNLSKDRRHLVTILRIVNLRRPRQVHDSAATYNHLCLSLVVGGGVTAFVFANRSWFPVADNLSERYREMLGNLNDAGSFGQLNRRKDEPSL